MCKRITVKQAVLEEIRNNAEAMVELVKHFNFISVRTLQTWMCVPKHTQRFTEFGALKIIEQYTGKTQEEILELPE